MAGKIIAPIFYYFMYVYKYVVFCAGGVKPTGRKDGGCHEAPYPTLLYT